MGDLEIIKIATGERTIIQMDGTVIKDQIEPPNLDWCDKCEKWKPKEFGRFDGSQGVAMIWVCMECK